MSGLALLHLHNVIAELALHDLSVANLLREDCLVKLRNHGSALGKGQFAAGVLATGIVRVLFGEVGKICAALDLLEEVLGLGLGGSIGLGIRARIDLDEDVARARLVGSGILGLMGVEVGLNLLLRGAGERRREYRWGVKAK